MALVKCPECGKDNVSDSAMCCPDCGYSIKEHFDRIKEEEKRIENERKRIEAEERRKQEQEDSKPERQEHTIKVLENQITKTKKEIRNSIIGLVVSVPLLLICWKYSVNGSLGILIVLFAIAIFICLVFLISGFGEVDKYENDLKTAKENFDKYEEISEIRHKQFVAQLQADKAKNAAKHPPCPLCGSTNTERLSTLNKTVSIAAVGLASSKIGKQYQCKNCKHKF